MSSDRCAEPALDDAVARYKAVLRDVLDRRPSGTRQRLADALRKNRSFISQISNTQYGTPIPAQHVATILEICHFAPAERAAFREGYARAHPGRLTMRGDLRALRQVTVEVPDLGDPRRNQALDQAIADVAQRLARFADDDG